MERRTDRRRKAERLGRRTAWSRLTSLSACEDYDSLSCTQLFYNYYAFKKKKKPRKVKL